MPVQHSVYDRDLDKNAANLQPLTPLSFLQRAAAVYPEHGHHPWPPDLAYAGVLFALPHNWHRRWQCVALGKGDTVSVLLANTPAMLECHYGVPMTKAVLNALNTRLDAATIGFSLDHAECKVFIVDQEFSGLAREALAMCKVKPLVIDYVDPEFAVEGIAVGTKNMKSFCKAGTRTLHGHGLMMNGTPSR